MSLEPPDDEFEDPDNTGNEFVERLEEALQRAREIGDTDEEARILLSLGEVYARKSEYEDASEMIEAGLAHLKATSQYAVAISPLFQLARIYRVLGRNDRAFMLFHEVIEFAEVIDNRCAMGYALACKGTILLDEASIPNGLEMLFRGYQILEELKLKETADVKEWIREYRRRVPRQQYELAIHQSAVSPKIKSILKAIE